MAHHPIFNHRRIIMAKKKKEDIKLEALQYIERIRVNGKPYYKKQELIKILRIFLDLYWR